MKLGRKIKHNEKVSRTKVRFLHLRSRSQSSHGPKSCLGNNSNTDQANVTKLHRNIENNEKVCCAKALGSYIQGQGHNQVRGKNCVSAITQKLLKQV